MPLRGKILNTWEVDAAEILGSQEVHDISVALGVDPGNDSLDGLRYHKVCILADADSDGLHIATLLCALFLRHFRELVLAGHVYVAMPPLYRIDVGKEVSYALDEGERKGILDRIEAEKMRGKVPGMVGTVDVLLANLDPRGMLPRAGVQAVLAELNKATQKKMWRADPEATVARVFAEIDGRNTMREIIDCTRLAVASNMGSWVSFFERCSATTSTSGSSSVRTRKTSRA